MIPLVPADDNVDSRLEMINQLKLFLVTAPDGWTNQDGSMKQHSLPTGESISCVKWNDAFFISGTDIVRCLVFRFLAFGRPVQNLKKFEEGVFSDLRNLKPGTDAILEEPKSDFLELLFKNNCIRTQKKQKVFYWFSVPHDRLFLDALERDLKREKMGIEPTSSAVTQPAVTISLDTTQALFDEFRKAMLSELNLDALLLVSQDDNNSKNSSSSSNSSCSGSETSPVATVVPRADLQKASTIFGQFSLFEGSPSYKQRRRRNAANLSQSHQPYPSCDSSKAVSARNHHPYHHNNNNNRDALWSSDSDPACTSNNTSSDNMETTRYFDCPLSSCAKIFKRLEHMKRHLRTHTMERPYLCDLCGKRFSRSDNLAQHKKTHKKHQQQQQQKQRQQQKQQRIIEDEEDEYEDDDMDYSLSIEEEEDDDDDSDYGMKSKNNVVSCRRRHRSFSDSPKQKNGRKYAKPSSTVVTNKNFSTVTSPSATSPYGRRSHTLIQRKRGLSNATNNGNNLKSIVNNNRKNNNNNEYDPNWSCNNNNNNNSHKTTASFRENYLKPCLSLSTTPSSSCHSSPSCLSESVPNSAVKIEQLDLFYDLASGTPLPSVTTETANNTMGAATIATNGNDFITASSLDHSQTSLSSLHQEHDYTTADWSHHYSTSSSPRYDGLVLNYHFDDSPYMDVSQNNNNSAYYDASNQDLLYPMNHHHHHSASTSPLPPLMVPFSSAAASPTDSCSDYLPTVVSSFYFNSPTMAPSDALVFK